MYLGKLEKHFKVNLFNRKITDFKQINKNGIIH